MTEKKKVDPEEDTEEDIAFGISLRPAIADGLRAAREEHPSGLNQKDFAKSLEIDQYYYNRLEKGHITPSVGRLARIADKLDTTIIQILQTPKDAILDEAEVLFSILSKELTEAQRPALVKMLSSLLEVAGIERPQAQKIPKLANLEKPRNYPTPEGLLQNEFRKKDDTLV